MKQVLADTLDDFTLPRYDVLPNMGLYLEQATRYINECVQPLGCISLTISMVRNYVKMGLVDNPVRKMYYRDQIAYLLVTAVLKAVLPLAHIDKLFSRQKMLYPAATAYNCFCEELESMLRFRFGITQEAAEHEAKASLEAEMLHSAASAVSQIIYLNICFEHLPDAAVQNQTAIRFNDNRL